MVFRLARILKWTALVLGIVIVTAIALRTRPRLYRYPEERPIVG